MFFIVWGARDKQRLYGRMETRFCEGCGGDRGFRKRARWEIFHIMYLARWVTHRDYAQVCEACGRQDFMDVRETEARLAEPVIPLVDRFGWAFVAAPLALWGLLALLGNR